MSFDNINKIVSLVLFFSMIATFLGTMALYAYYKVSEQKRKSLPKPVAQKEAAQLTPIAVMPQVAATRPEAGRRRIRFG